ncbi:hypothetical protein [Rhizobium sp. MHM7A]|uniref:hypothetical protein n=1 Tax=Rhizobium sp. MHM7A TaxID=2583233 RepID=UPI001107413C|nr:hypothetical protein [Rhizobium sp. MHM7A]TLX08080.1 hypothetical protein FFR93_29500 [Rhizobium sp. MHM7A]
MNIKSMIDRKLVLLVVTPLARALLSALVGYLASKGAPADQIEQLAAALGAGGVVVFNICWEFIDRRKAVNKAEARLIGELGLHDRTAV